MRKNVCGYDRLVRLIEGPALLVVGLLWLSGGISVDAGIFGTIIAATLVVLGLDLLVTGLLQRCPVNYLLGVDTCPDGEAEPASG